MFGLSKFEHFTNPVQYPQPDGTGDNSSPRGIVPPFPVRMVTLAQLDLELINLLNQDILIALQKLLITIINYRGVIFVYETFEF